MLPGDVCALMDMRLACCLLFGKKLARVPRYVNVGACHLMHSSIRRFAPSTSSRTRSTTSFIESLYARTTHRLPCCVPSVASFCAPSLPFSAHGHAGYLTQPRFGCRRTDAASGGRSSTSTSSPSPLLPRTFFGPPGACAAIDHARRSFPRRPTCRQTSAAVTPKRRETDRRLSLGERRRAAS